VDFFPSVAIEVAPLKSEEEASDSTEVHCAGEIGRGFFANPQGFDSVAKGGGSGGGAD
jgi:hypothetical protein